MNILLKDHENCSIDTCNSLRTKCKVIATSKCEPSFTIEDYKIYQINNIENIGVKEQEYYGWNVSYDERANLTTEHYYFIIDGLYHNAWSHWVEESAIYLPLYLKLKSLFPSLKIYSFEKKGYKNAMYKAFNIPQEDIVYELNKSNNTCLFPYYVSLGDHRTPFLFFKHMKTFYNWIIEKCPPIEKDIDVLYLPRGSKENCQQNDRQIPVQADLIQVLSRYKNVKILFTDSVENMIEQWTLVRRAKTIILNEGSSLLINGFFALNSHIISLGGEGNHAHIWNPSPALVYYDTIHRGNKYYYIPYEWPIQYVMPTLLQIMSDSVVHQAIPKYNCHLQCKYCKYQDIENYAEDRSSLL